MTEEKKEKIDQEYRTLSKYVWMCVRSKDEKERIKFGMALLKYLDNSRKNDYRMIEMFDDLINKLTSAAQTIQDQNDWLDCIYAAIGDDPEKILRTASIARKVLKNKIKRLRRED